ncbi:uncharacterized protein YkwD [Microbacteriaceae bacterium SG_E_30_P1]|uniref:Uncharacterized protein YkwD n=1 Tax=Antiquaquibacter oligotrophicus TaxID=2880260 RepID=A0ABT6KP84_9MICO|nr:hypothetical protein [Antiquaquibacter oligotrophicus]MDH6181800.1 uncharacterized protein YkwD [Antiquaquibacter oligotrophicus]UDF12520.1 hypothetical protein LH407_10190 [Antiquaquibacter oligotrophicus]
MTGFGIPGGAAAAVVMALALVVGGGIGASAPTVAESGSATPPFSRSSAVLAPQHPTTPSPRVAVVETIVVAAADSVAPEAAPIVETAAPSPTGAEQPSAAAGEPELAAALEFAAATTATDPRPWETADKQIAPGEVHPALFSTDPETIARVQALRAQGKSCPDLGGFTTSGAPSARSAQGVPGTTTADLVSFAQQYNLIRYQNCLPPVSRFVYDSCMEARLFWMAESPSPDPLDAWGHIGTVRIDGVPSVGCDGNLAGGSGNTGATVATKWWQSLSHRASLYRPTWSTSGVCIALAMTHGGIDEPASFTRAAASWRSC